MCNDKEKRKDCNECNCISDILNRIIHLQRNSYRSCPNEGCDKPFLGPDNIECFNTSLTWFYKCNPLLIFQYI